MGDLFKKLTVILAFFQTFAIVLGAQVTKCVSGRELIVRKTLKTFVQAEQACQNLGGSLLKVDNAEITNRINTELRAGEKHYFIGARSEGGHWKWRDGTEIGYHEWLPGEPNGANEHCVAVNIDKQGNKGWLDISCSSAVYYMCQKVAKLTLTVTSTSITLSSPGTHTVTCEEKTSCSSSTVSWYKGSSAVIQSQTSSVYQTIGSQSSNLVLRSAKIGDSGTYQCRATASDSRKDQRDLTVTVDGSPKIMSAIVVACTSNINVLWTPHSLALGYLHKLKAYVDPIHPRILHKTPHYSSQIATTFTNLLPSTKYTIQIMACTSSSACPNSSVATRNLLITTGGVPNFVRNAKFQNDNGVCRLSWQEPDVKGDAITGYVISLSKKFTSTRAANKTTEILVFNTTNTFHSFMSLPNRNYSAAIRSVACGGESVPVHASGKCFGPPRAPVGLKPPAVSIRSEELLGNVTVEVPDEINGTMSCLFVIISNVKRVGNETGNQTQYSLGNLLMANSSESTTNGDYIGVAIPASRFAFKQHITTIIGDNSTSSCNLYETKHDGVIVSNLGIPTWNDGTILGQSKLFSSDGQYRAFVVAVVPRVRNLLLRRSPGTKFSTHRIERDRASTSPTTPYTLTSQADSSQADSSDAEVEQDSSGKSAFQFEPINFLIATGTTLLIVVGGALAWKLCKTRKAATGTSRNNDTSVKQGDSYEVMKPIPGNIIGNASTPEFILQDNNYSEITTQGETSAVARKVPKDREVTNGISKKNDDPSVKQDNHYEEIDGAVTGNNITEASSSEVAIQDHNYSEITTPGATCSVAAGDSAYEMWQC